MKYIINSIYLIKRNDSEIVFKKASKDMKRESGQQYRLNHSEIPVEKSCTKTVKFCVLCKPLFATIQNSASSVYDLALKSKTCTISEHLKNVPSLRCQGEKLFLLNKVLKIKKTN